jgi:acyl-CoA thioesterase FadM
MNRFVRITATIARASRRTRIGCYEPAELPLRVWPGEADYRYVHQAVYPLYMELGRWDFAVRCGLAGFLITQRCVGIVGSQIIHCQRPLARFQRFVVRTHAASWDDKWLYLETRVEAEGKPYSWGCTRLLFRDGKGRKLPPSDVMRAAGGDDRSSPVSVAAGLLAQFERPPA